MLSKKSNSIRKPKVTQKTSAANEATSTRMGSTGAFERVSALD